MVRGSALSHIPFLLLEIQQYSVGTSNSKTTICIHGHGIFSSSSPECFLGFENQWVGSERESHVLHVDACLDEGFSGGRICHTARAKA